MTGADIRPCGCRTPGEIVARRLAKRVAVAEVNYADAVDNTRVARCAVSGEVADAVAETAIAALGINLTPWGLRDAVRTFIADAGPRPSAASPVAYGEWWEQVINRTAQTLYDEV